MLKSLNIVSVRFQWNVDNIWFLHLIRYSVSMSVLDYGVHYKEPFTHSFKKIKHRVFLKGCLPANLDWQAVGFVFTKRDRIVEVHTNQGRSQGDGVLGWPWSPFVSHVLSRQPTTGGKKDMKIWWETSFWHRVTPPSPPLWFSCLENWEMFMYVGVIWFTSAVYSGHVE